MVPLGQSHLNEIESEVQLAILDHNGDSDVQKALRSDRGVF